MDTESKIYDDERPNDAACNGFYDFGLLKTTTYAALYRASKAGKHFFVKTTKDNSERQIAMLRREYELSIGCDHPHIVHVYTFEENLPVGQGVVMEYIKGRTLAEYLAERPSSSDRKRIFGELLSAVGYLHKRGVIHNDLKPENILVTHADNSLKLIDFGLADNDAQMAMRVLGCTPRYASPELRAQNRNIDARSDIYSIGVLMGEIFDGQYRRMAKRCSNLRPDRRYDNIAALQYDWQHRNRPQKLLLGMVAVVVFMLPFVLLGHVKLAEWREAKERQLLFTQIERDVKQIYEVFADSVSKAVYSEFAFNNIRSYDGEMAKYQQEHIATIADIELNTLALHVYLRTTHDCHRRLWEQANALPSIYKTDMCAEERRFYCSLREKHIPYRPYRGK
ncbi:MAG: serine/threonine protein kinase [Alistipes sp.]